MSKRRRSPTIEVVDLTNEDARRWWPIRIAIRLVERLKSQKWGAMGGRAKAAGEAAKANRDAKKELLAEAEMHRAEGRDCQWTKWTLAEDSRFKHWKPRTIENMLGEVFSKRHRDE